MLALAALILVTFRSRAVHASEADLTVLVSVSRRPEPGDCPDREALIGRVQALVRNRPASRPLAAIPVVVEMDRADAGYHATVSALGGVRELTDPGPTCEGLADAVALIIAMTLAGDSGDSTPPTPSPSPSPSAHEIPPSPSWRTAGRAPIWLSGYVGAGTAAAIVRPVAATLSGELDAGIESASIGVGAFHIATQSLPLTPGHINASGTGGYLLACWSALGRPKAVRSRVCFEPTAALLTAKAQGYSSNGATTRPWLAPGIAIDLEAPIVGPIRWSARASLLVPVRRERFRVEGVGTAYDPAPFAFFGTIGLGVSNW